MTIPSFYIQHLNTKHYIYTVYMRQECGLTGAGGAVGVVAGVGGCPVAPQAGVALAVRAGGVARRAAELRGAAAGADGALAREEPTSDCRSGHNNG